jgi:triosephosphate isomerase
MADRESEPRDGRRPLIGTSTKMHLVPSAMGRYLDRLAPAVRGITDRDLFVLPSFPALDAARARLTGTNIAWGAQDVHPEDGGAHTGDVAAPMLADLGCRYVEVGHAERRRDHGETPVLVAAKVGAILRWGMAPIVCLGETRRADPATTVRSLVAELGVILGGVADADLPQVIVAYEPVWAIGEGAEAASPAEAGEVHDGLRAWLDALALEGGAVRIIYGGSVNQGNAAGLLAQQSVDGLFVGRQALDAEVFAAIASTPLRPR